MSQLETLDASENELTRISGLDKLNNLRVLNLSKNKIRSAAGLEALVSQLSRSIPANFRRLPCLEFPPSSPPGARAISRAISSRRLCYPEKSKKLLK